MNTSAETDATQNVSDQPEKPGLRRSRRKESIVSPLKVDRLPPFSVEAEQGVLGCLFLAPQEAIGECIQKLTAGPEAFYDLRHRTIYELLVEMYDRREAIDVITVQQRLKDKGQLDGIGGVTYLSVLADTVPSAANLDYYLGIVRDKHVLRRLVQTCTDAVGRVYEHDGQETDSLLDELERDVLRLRETRLETALSNAKDLVHASITVIEELHARKGALTGLPTGFDDFDHLTGGLQPADMIVIAARPSVGKTSWSMNVAEHVVVEQGLPVAVFSLEMKAEALMRRMLCSRARVNHRDIRDGFLAERDFPKLTGAAGKLAKASLWIDDSPGLSILQLRARARRLWQQYKARLIIVDYLQLVRSTNRRTQSVQEEISDVSMGLKALAKELNVPVLCCCQLNREVERERGRRPRLSDLRSSGSIEQDADVVGLLYRPKADDEDGPENDDAEAINMLIAKQRNGPTGDVALTFLKGYTRFESAAKVTADDVAEFDCRPPHND